MRLFATFAAVSSLFLSAACGGDGASSPAAQQTPSLRLRELTQSPSVHDTRASVPQPPSSASQADKQLTRVSQLLHQAMSRGDVISNPHSDSGRDPYVFVSSARREDFLLTLAQADIRVPVSIPTLAECEERGMSGNDAGAREVTAQAQVSCGPGCVYQTVGYCEGGLLDGVIHNLGYKYGAYTHAFNYIAGTMVPFSAELSLPSTSSTAADYNFDYNFPRELYVERFSDLSSANRAKHRCCYWFWGSPSWNIQCSPYFYSQL